MAIISTFPGKAKPKLQSKTATPSTSQQIVTPDTAYEGLDKVTVNAMKLQSKSVSPSTSAKTVYPDSSYDGLSSVRIDSIGLTTGTYNPSEESAKTYYPPSGYDGFSSITVNQACCGATSVENATTENSQLNAKTFYLSKASGAYLPSDSPDNIVVFCYVSKPSPTSNLNILLSLHLNKSANDNYSGCVHYFNENTLAVSQSIIYDSSYVAVNYDGDKIIISFPISKIDVNFDARLSYVCACTWNTL